VRKKTQAIAAELEALAIRGRITPQRVVAWAARHRRSALHACFTWDNTKAAHEYRLFQARHLIVSVQVVYEDGKARQVFVSPLTSRGPTGGYLHLVDVLGSAKLRRQFLAQALDELRRVLEKYNDLVELAGVRTAVRLVRVR